MACGVPIAGYSNEAFRGVLATSGAGWATPMAGPLSWLLASPRSAMRASRLTASALAFAREHTFEKEFERRMVHARELAGLVPFASNTIKPVNQDGFKSSGRQSPRAKAPDLVCAPEKSCPFRAPRPRHPLGRQRPRLGEGACSGRADPPECAVICLDELRRECVIYAGGKRLGAPAESLGRMISADAGIERLIEVRGPTRTAVELDRHKGRVLRRTSPMSVSAIGSKRLCPLLVLHRMPRQPGQRGGKPRLRRMRLVDFPPDRAGGCAGVGSTTQRAATGRSRARINASPGASPCWPPSRMLHRRGIAASRSGGHPTGTGRCESRSERRRASLQTEPG